MGNIVLYNEILMLNLLTYPVITYVIAVPVHFFIFLLGRAIIHKIKPKHLNRRTLLISTSTLSSANLVNICLVSPFLWEVPMAVIFAFMKAK